MPTTRQPYARQFYPDNCREQIEHFLKNYKVPEGPAKAVGGIVPHAGWVFSGAVAAKVFKCLSPKSDPDTFILLGAVVKALGAEKGYLLEYTTSHDVMPKGEFEMAVGYAGILF